MCVYCVNLNPPCRLPEQAVPVLKFLNATDFKLQQTDLYKNTLKQYLENKYVVESTGWKPLAETINGRGAMLVSVVWRVLSSGSHPCATRPATAHPLSWHLPRLTLVALPCFVVLC